MNDADLESDRIMALRALAYMNDESDDFPSGEHPSEVIRRVLQSIPDQLRTARADGWAVARINIKSGIKALIWRLDNTMMTLVAFWIELDELLANSENPYEERQ